jgi:hypothetical protein
MICSLYMTFNEVPISIDTSITVTSISTQCINKELETLEPSFPCSKDKCDKGQICFKQLLRLMTQGRQSWSLHTTRQCIETHAQTAYTVFSWGHQVTIIDSHSVKFIRCTWTRCKMIIKPFDLTVHLFHKSFMLMGYHCLYTGHRKQC